MIVVQPGMGYGSVDRAPGWLGYPGFEAPEAALGSVPNAASSGQVIRLPREPDAADGKNAGSALFESRGAPPLAAPKIAFNADELLCALQEIQLKSQDAQLQTALNGLEAARVAAGKNSEAQLKKIEEWVKKSEEADRKGVLAEILGWIGKVAAVVASAAAVAISAVATAVTGGAMAPLLILSSLALASASMTLADHVSRSNGGPGISIGNLLTTLSSKALEGFGVPRETAEKIGKVVAGAAALVIPVAILIEPQLLGTMASGIAGLVGADPKTAAYIGTGVGVAAALTAGILMTIATCGAGAGVSAMQVGNALTAASSQLVQGAVSATQGGTTMAAAIDQAEAECAIASRKQLEGRMVKLQKVMEDQCDDVRTIFRWMSECARVVSGMIAETIASMSQISANIGKQGTV